MGRRIERINHLIRKEISELLRRQVKDPRLGGFITVTRVSTSPDLRHAKVFVSIMGTEIEKEEALQALAVASSFLHRELRSCLTLYRTPQLSFHADETIGQGAQILQMIDRVAENEGGES